MLERKRSLTDLGKFPSHLWEDCSCQLLGLEIKRSEHKPNANPFISVSRLLVLIWLLFSAQSILPLKLLEIYVMFTCKPKPEPLLQR